MKENIEKLFEDKDFIELVKNKMIQIAQQQNFEEVQKEKKFPQDGDEFYYVSKCGHIYSEKYIGNYYDLCQKKIGNIFETEEEAEFEVERLKVLKELKEFACDIKEFKLYDDKWYLSYNALDKKINIDRDGIFARHGIYFKRKEDAEQVLELVGEERIIKYYIGIKENENDK